MNANVRVPASTLLRLRAPTGEQPSRKSLPPDGPARTLKGMPSTRVPTATPPPRANEPTLAAIVAQEQRPLWRYLRLLGADAHEADDLLQDTFVQFATGERTEAPRHVGAFLRGIARNLLLAARRRQRRAEPDAH